MWFWSILLSWWRQSHHVLSVLAMMKPQLSNHNVPLSIAGTVSQTHRVHCKDTRVRAGQTADPVASLFSLFILESWQWSVRDWCSEKVEIKRQRRKAFLSRQPSLDLKSQTIPGYGKKIQNYIIISFLEIVVPEKWWFIKLFWFFYLVFSFSFWPFTEAGGQQWPQAH